jgi:hypothetical protein
MVWALEAAEKLLICADLIAKNPRGLKRLRKKSGFESRFTKNIPRGLKPSVYFQPLAAPFDFAQGRLLKPCPFKTSAIW